MSRHMFGWSYPPGAAGDPNAPWNQDDGYCEICYRNVHECLCPECPVCGTCGDLRCYGPASSGAHGMEESNEQRASREKEEKVQAEALAAEEAYWAAHSTKEEE